MAVEILEVAVQAFVGQVAQQLVARADVRHVIRDALGSLP
jgi:hypothetical protein